MKPQSAIHPTSLFQTSLLASTPPHAFRSRNKHPASPMLLPSRPSRSPAAVVPPLKATIQDFGAAIASRFTPRAASIPKEISVLPGAAEPLGPSYVAANATGNPSPGTAGINFALAAPHADSLSLCLYDRNGNAVEEAPMHLDFSKAGVWTAFVPGLPSSGVLYGVRVKGLGGWDTPFRWDASRVLLDPWAPLVVGRGRFGVRDAFESFAPGVGSRFLGAFDFASPAFDWGRDYRRPGLAQEDMVIMELPVRCFTAHESSGLPPAQRGTFAGVAEKIPELLELGVNAVELLPVFEYDELEFQVRPNPRDHMTNVWGYSHLSFMAPMSRFGTARDSNDQQGSDPVATAREFKDMVKRLHAAGIEVILDVVYNHTAEADDVVPYMLSWRGIDAKEYYQQDPDSQTALVNTSGCGNTFNSNGDLGRRLIMDSLRSWVEEYHVDGFRFDLASCLCRGQFGEALKDPPLIREIAKDPVLQAARVKIIAEPWDLGMYQVGTFPAYKRWSEWNGQYRDDVRRFIRGDPGMKPSFASRLSGSEDLYHASERKPYHSINFVIAHDGFTLWDLVSYDGKHNDANGEGNRDGTNDNFSWNCGVEGDTQDPGVLSLRHRQARNLHLALMLSQGTPMLLAGDEYGQTRHGNNNWYGHDTELTHIRWDLREAAKSDEGNGWFRYYTELIKFRKACPLLGRSEFLTPEDVTWHEDRWDDPESRFLAFTLHDAAHRTGGQHGDLYAAFNAHPFEVTVPLPSPPAGRQWVRLVDTNLPSPRDWTAGGNAGVDERYRLQGHSAILLWAKRV